MSESVLIAKNLNKAYKETLALNSFHMRVRKGDIYALAGPNGAGKTTLIRLITGLAKKTGGELLLFGESDEAGYQRVRKNIGTLIEMPVFYQNRTARQNLEINRRMKQIDDREAVSRALRLVGLEDTKKKVKDYSLGMKQRLGIAKALLAGPECLILDEPTNGLDPLGIIELRNLLARLNQEYGITIILCSHILKELEMIATCYGMIKNGRMIQEFKAEEMPKLCGSYLSIRVNDTAGAGVILKETMELSDVEDGEENELRIYDSNVKLKDVSRVLGENGLEVEEFTHVTNTLESYFTSVMEEN